MFYTLPNSTEDVFTRYILANYTGPYPVVRAFSLAPRSLPMIMVKAGSFHEEQPGMGVYNGVLTVAIITQIDDTPDPIATHDSTVAAVYSLLASPTALAAFVNTPGSNFHLWGMYSTDYEQGIEIEGTDRGIVSRFQYALKAQTLEA